MRASNATGVSHCGAWPAASILCTAPRHRVGMRQLGEIGAVDEPLLGAMQHRQRLLQAGDDLDFVARDARRHRSGDLRPRAAVGAQRVLDEEGGNVGETGGEERGDIGFRLLARHLGREARRHRRVGQERIRHRRREPDRRRAENGEAARPRQVFRRLEQDVAAKAPADEQSLVEVEIAGDRHQARARGRAADRRPRSLAFSDRPWPSRSIATTRRRRPSEPSSWRENARDELELPWTSTIGGPSPADWWTASAPLGVW